MKYTKLFLENENEIIRSWPSLNTDHIYIGKKYRLTFGDLSSNVSLQFPNNASLLDNTHMCIKKLQSH